jgi:hypothetical protein
MKDKKPAGLVLIAIYCSIWGVVMIPIGGISAMAPTVADVPEYTGPLGIVILAFGLAMIAGAYGIWRVKSWGRTFNIWRELAGLPLSVMTLVGFVPGGKVTVGNQLSSVVGIILTVLIIRYLSSDKTKRFFAENCIKS